MPAADPKSGIRPHRSTAVRTNFVRVRVSSGLCAPSATVSASGGAGPACLQLPNPVRSHQVALTLPAGNTVLVLRTPTLQP